jgi:hypothetical protein
MEFYLSNTHWFDAFDGPVEEHAAALADVIRRVLRKEKLAGSDTELNLRLAETLREMPVQKRTAPETHGPNQPSAPKAGTTKPTKLVIAASACALVGILAAVLFFWRIYRSGEGQAIAPKPDPVRPWRDGDEEERPAPVPARLDPLTKLREIRIHAKGGVRVIKVVHEGGTAIGIGNRDNPAPLRVDGHWIHFHKSHWNYKTKRSRQGQKIDFIYDP